MKITSAISLALVGLGGLVSSQTATNSTGSARTTIVPVAGASTYTQFCAGTVFCVAAVPIPSFAAPTSIQFTVWSSSASWVAFGPGTGMSDADVYVGWNALTTKAFIVSDRTSTGYSVPVVDATSQITPLTAVPAQLALVVPSTAKTVFSFSRPLTATLPNKVITKGVAASFIWAQGSVRPTQDIQSSAFGKHDTYGKFTMDFLTATAGTNTNSGAAGGPILTVVGASMIHGIIMTVAWTICPLGGIFVARYLKDALGKWWYYTHLILMLGGATILSTAGIVFIVLTTSAPHFSLSSPHKPLGLAIGIDGLLQAILGYVCNAMWSPERREIPWWDKVHWWNGRLLFVLALVNIYLGLRLMAASATITVAYFVFVGVSLAALVAGQFYFGQVHHMKKDDDAKSYNPNMEIGAPSMGRYENKGY